MPLGRERESSRRINAGYRYVRGPIDLHRPVGYPRSKLDGNTRHSKSFNLGRLTRSLHSHGERLAIVSIVVNDKLIAVDELNAVGN